MASYNVSYEVKRTVLAPRAGHAWTTDYGNPDEVEAFEWIYPYSPVHNVRRPIGGTRQYPAMLLTTGTLHVSLSAPTKPLHEVDELQSRHEQAALWPSNWLGMGWRRI